MSIGFVENAGLGPCELQDPVWAKMSALATGVNKKRKKSETKPQAQINKCNNEKRRREQENIYIEELAELISANFADMSSLSVKPDKCAILQETVNQIRSIKQRESASQSRDPVQQGEVSSSRPIILSNEVYGPLLLEALEGFLFVVNTEGKVEHVTENVSNYIKYTREDIFGNSIYNFIHLGDHARFSSTLMPMTIGWDSDTNPTRSRSFSARFLVKPPDDQEESVEEKTTRDNIYQVMHISSTQLRDPSENEEDQQQKRNDKDKDGPYLLCVASRVTQREKIPTIVEQFTTKLDTSGKIIAVDTTGLSPFYTQNITKEFFNRPLRDLVPQSDLHKLNGLLKDCINVGHAQSQLYKLQISSDRFLTVQTKTKLFKGGPSDPEFIMATHSVLSDFDAIGPSDPGGGGTSGVGGPLMTSVVNGARNGTAPMNTAPDVSVSNALMNSGNTASFSTYTLEPDFSFDIFPSSTFELETSAWTETRPESRQSGTPVSTPTPRPPSNPAYSPATTVAQSPLASFVTQPSPSTPAAPNPYTSTFPFSPLPEQNYNVEEPKDTKANVLDEASTMMAESGRLRNLLTKPPTVADSSANNNDGRNKHTILKCLLNQQDEDDNRSDNRTSPRAGLVNRGPVAGPSELPKTSTENQMLLQLLNDRSDDDDNLEARAGVRKKSELLHQLLKTESRDNEDEKKSDIQTSEDSLLRSLGFSNSPSSPNGEPGRTRKRPSDDRDDPIANKRPSDGSQVSSTGTGTGSKLCEKNKMLASLLAKQPNNQQPIPHIPSSVLSATPQDGLPRISLPDTVKTSKPMPTRSTTSATPQRTVVKNAVPDMSRMNTRQPNTNYLNTMLTHTNSIHHQRTNNQMGQVESGSYTSPTSSSAEGNMDAQMWGDNNNVSANDPLLSDILDQVMDIVPDEIGRAFSHGEGQQQSNFQNELSEKMAINIIQKSLMQCESAVKSPSSPTITLPGTPPAYNPATMTTQNSQMRPFQPPPNYPQSGFISKQRLPVRPGAPQYAVASNNQLLIQRKQQEERRRLLQQQQQQELLIPSNATTGELGSIQNIDNLLNSTVAPNVSLQRSASLPESQLSPNYGGQMNQQNQRINSQQPYSPHSQLVSPIGQQSGFPQNSANYQQAAARLSPQFNQQMSLRQAYPQGNPQGQNWQQNSARLSMQNPMLNAQLTRTPNQPQQGPPQQPAQQQRSINSPGTVTSRHSPYQQDAFPPPSSPNSAAFNHNQNQYLRLQRANSVPTATTQLPGGLGSPRPYGREHHPHPYPPIPSNPHQHPMMYQQDSSQYCYDQTGLQLAYNGADRGRAPPHLQAGVSASAPASEFVRQELRAVVGARTGQAQSAPNRTPQSQLLNQQQVDLDALGLTFELPTSGASDSPKHWGAMGSDLGSMSPQPATSRTTMEEARPGDHTNKSSLLQKLLSE